MIISLVVIFGVAVLLAACWKFVLEFLNGPVRDLLEGLFGAKKCEWYGAFLSWCDKKVSTARRIVKMQWRKFRDTVLKINSTYTRNEDGSYTKRTETIVRKDEKSAKRVYTEETVGWEYLPDAVREELIKRRTNAGEIDDRELVAEKVRQRAGEEGIELTA